MVLDEQTTTVSEDILSLAQATITKALAKENLSDIDRAVLETQNYFLMFLRNDHRKISEMYPYFTKNKKRDEAMTKWGNAVAMMLIAEVIGLLFFFLK